MQRQIEAQDTDIQKLAKHKEPQRWACSYPVLQRRSIQPGVGHEALTVVSRGQMTPYAFPPFYP